MNQKKDLYGSTSLGLINRLYRLRSKTLTPLYAEFGITYLQSGIIQALYDNNGCIQKDLCDVMGVTPQVMVKTINQMEAQGLLERRRSDANRRVLYVHITEKGKEIAEEIRKIALETENKFLDELTKKERDELKYLLVKAFLSWNRKIDSNSDDVEEF